MIKQENMKKLKFLLVAFVALCLTTAVQAQKSKAKTKTKQAVTATYQCPMKCEGEKTYAKAGDCPVCGMHLKAVTKATAYQCPMKCEGDKTYAKEGNCPVCNMKIKPVVKKEKPKNTTHKNNHS